MLTLIALGLLGELGQVNGILVTHFVLVVMSLVRHVGQLFASDMSSGCASIIGGEESRG